jgi:hypothetical protein
MGMQEAYNEFAAAFWADPDPEVCYCHGRGWALSDFDTWHQCPIHFKGQLSPETYYSSFEEYEQRNAESMAEYQRLRCEKPPLRNPAYDTSPMGIFAEYDITSENNGECPECRDGANFSPLECPLCGDSLKKELAEEGANDDDIPF